MSNRALLPMKEKVLFVCVHNGARSQMAEALLNQICCDQFEAHSAGLEPGTLNPIAVEAMAEIGIDISGKKTKSVSETVKSGETFAHVITVCDEAGAERCPVFPGTANRLHWAFPDPSSFRGSHAEVLHKTRAVRDAIKQKIESWCADFCGQPNSRQNSAITAHLSGRYR